MWLQLIQLYDGSSKIREQKYHLLRTKYDEFKMLPNECRNDMFSRLNLIVKKLNSLNVSNLDKGIINHNILMLIPNLKYNIINFMLQKEDLNEMKVVELVGELMKWVSLAYRRNLPQANLLLSKPMSRRSLSSRWSSMRQAQVNKKTLMKAHQVMKMMIKNLNSWWVSSQS
jgi:hypothetical protein